MIKTDAAKCGNIFLKNQKRYEVKKEKLFKREVILSALLRFVDGVFLQ